MTGLGFGGYALAEPFRLNMTRYVVTPSRWPSGLALRVAVVADLHVCEPWMNMARVNQIVARTNAAAPDVILLLGDYVPSHRMLKFSRMIPHDEWAASLAKLNAPLGVHAVLGNHDWWEHTVVQSRRSGPTAAGEALKRAGIPVYENDAIKLHKGPDDFWFAGLGDQWAFWPRNKKERADVIPYRGVDDIDATLSQVTDDAPVILMAHEPDAFADMTDRVALTVSGHTHGGQINMLGFTPIVPSRYGSRFVYGHVNEGERNLIVSGGLGVSGLPLRFGVPPEVVVIDVTA